MGDWERDWELVERHPATPRERWHMFALTVRTARHPGVWALAAWYFVKPGAEAATYRRRG
jgi:hypothetical protein